MTRIGERKEALCRSHVPSPRHCASTGIRGRAQRGSQRRRHRRCALKFSPQNQASVLSFTSLATGRSNIGQPTGRLKFTASVLVARRDWLASQATGDGYAAEIADALCCLASRYAMRAILTERV